MSALVNLDAECEVLGGLMRENAVIDRVADILTSEDFSEPLHSRIFAALVEQAMQGKGANPVTIKGYFENDETLAKLGGNAYLARLFTGALGLDVVENARMLTELSQRRRMADGLKMAALDCEDLSIPTADVIAEADAAISEDGRDGINQLSAADCARELFRTYSEKHLGVTSGKIEALDKLIGPMRPKQLVIGAARPGMGKTALALSYAVGAAESGHGVLYISLEMSGPELAARIISDLCFDRNKIPYPNIRDGELKDWEKQELCSAEEYLRGLPFEVVDVGNLTVGRLNMLIRRHSRRMAANGHKLELVIIDYLQLLSPDGRGRSHYEAVSEVSRSLKAAAKDNGVAIFALAQLSRSVENRPDRRPQLSDLRDSGQIEQDADAVLFLRREEYYLRQEEPDKLSPKRAAWEELLREHAGKIEFILAKRRNGVTGNALGQFHGYFQAVRG